MNQPVVLTVSQITQAIKLQLERTFPEVWIKGEISNFRRQSSGHLYFSLKDHTAQISCVMFRGQAATLQRLPKEGDQVTLQGQINVYPPRGNYQLIVRSLTFSGLGALLLQLEQLKETLKKRGWFDEEHKKALPPLPRTIGLVTSPTGAAIRDMLHVLKRRFPGVRLLINPVKVQGEGAAQEIARGVGALNYFKLCDLIIVGRGGGSIEDLWAFNEECVAQAIWESQIPVISAVGHETDYCLSDLVADKRAPTPSAAAEIAVPEKAQLQRSLLKLSTSLNQRLQHILREKRQHLYGIHRHPYLCYVDQLLGPSMQKLDELKTRLDTLLAQRIQHASLSLQALQNQARALNPRNRIQEYQRKLVQGRSGIESALFRNLTRFKKELSLRSQLLDQSIFHQLKQKKLAFRPDQKQSQLQRILQLHLQRKSEQLKQLTDHLQAIHPDRLLQRGFSILFSEKTHSIIRSVQDFADGSHIRVRLRDGEVKATLKDVEITCQRNNNPSTP